MEGLKKGILVKNSVAVGAVGDKYFSTCPLGTVLSYAGNIIPRGFLVCNGASYPTVDYPDLYAVIGNIYGGDTENFNVPDYRETVLVGVGENTTDTIASHDVYGLGEFKDDQLQEHKHDVSGVGYGASSGTNWQYSTRQPKGDEYSDNVVTTSNNISRTGTTTHSKQKGVTYIIKAFHTNEGVDGNVQISDNETVEDKTWSSSKIASEIPTTLPANGGNSDTVNNHTVKSDVPENAVFTDTVYDDTEIKAEISKKADKSYVDNNFATMDKVNDLGSYINGVKLTPTTDGNLENQVNIGTIKLPKGKWIIFASGWNPTDAYDSEIIIGLNGSFDCIRQYNTVMFNFSAFRNVTTETTYTLAYSQGSGTSKNVATNYNFYAVKVGF